MKGKSQYLLFTSEKSIEIQGFEIMFQGGFSSTEIEVYDETEALVESLEGFDTNDLKVF